MAPIAVFVVALLLASANSQTTQALAFAPWFCMRPVAQESTGEVWAELWLCRWNETFHIDAPKAVDATIRTGEDLCLSGGGSEGAFFETCKEGAPLQKWEFVPAGVTAETLATPHGPDNVPGQIVLASADANVNRPKMCLKGDAVGAEGTRVVTVQCDSVSSGYTTWTYAPPPPANKTLLVMPARHAAGVKACVQPYSNRVYMRVGDCGDEDLVANWWVRDGELIRAAAGGRCLYADSYVAVYDCKPDDRYQGWSLGEDGSLTHTTLPEEGCLTYVGEAQGFEMATCTGHGNQNFAFLSAAPATDAVQVA